MRRRSWLLGLLYLLAAVLPLTAVARVCLPAAATVARDLPAPEPRPPIVILAVETETGPAVLVVETASGRALLAVETAAGPRPFCLKTASGIPLSGAKTAAEYGVDFVNPISNTVAVTDLAQDAQDVKPGDIEEASSGFFRWLAYLGQETPEERQRRNDLEASSPLWRERQAPQVPAGPQLFRLP